MCMAVSPMLVGAFMELFGEVSTPASSTSPTPGLSPRFKTGKLAFTEALPYIQNWLHAKFNVAEMNSPPDTDP